MLQLLHFQAGHPGSSESGSKAASQGRRGTDELLGHFIPEHNQVRREKYYQELELSQRNCICRLPGMSETEPGWQQLGLLFLGFVQDGGKALPVFPSCEFPRVTAPHHCSACLHTKVWATLSPPSLVFTPLCAQPPSQALLALENSLKNSPFSTSLPPGSPGFLSVDQDSCLKYLLFFFPPSKLHIFRQRVLTALMRFFTEIAGSWKTQPLPRRDPGLCLILLPASPW